MIVYECLIKVNIGHSAICADIVRGTEIRVGAPILEGPPLLLDLLDVLLGQPFHVLV